jgi:hypothetical protein
MFDVSKAFLTSSETILDFFQRPGVGFYIPLYQREYSWDKENIDQLMEDICRGVESLTNEDDSSAIRFLGTIIILLEKDPRENIKPQDHRALPEKIFNLIDGQQRISTISLLACLLYQRLYELQKQLPKEDIYNGLREAVDRYLLNLFEVFSVDLKRGSPAQKPIIIRGSIDGWTYDGDETHYKSDVSSFLAIFIRAIHNGNENVNEIEFPAISRGSLVKKNLRKMKSWLKTVENAYKTDVEDEQFPPAWKIVDCIPQKYLWSYERSDLVSLVKERGTPMSRNEKRICSLIQLIAFCYYLFQRCCFTLIEPKSEDWAFDMFQSLNATGTPLTAIETFKPLVVNLINSDNTQFKDSQSEQYFAKIDQLFSDLSSASSKSKLTNDYLTLLGLTYDGGKRPSRQFSDQRRWLTDKYKECESLDEKEKFIRQMSDVAQYWENVIKFKPDTYDSIPKTEMADDKNKKRAALSILYLQDAGHKMAHTVLSRFYSLCLKEQANAEKEFASACQIVAAFFTLWRSCFPNTGLDEVYRRILREKISWKFGDSQVSVDVIKKYFNQILEEKGIGTKPAWKNKAINELKYNQAQAVCKFALFVTSEDTIPDRENPGLMKVGTPGSYSFYLNPIQWNSNDFKTIEHIAPQQPQNPSTSKLSWDSSLYEDDNYEKIGNLTLLPTDINSSASNKDWIEKWIYYQHLAEKDPEKLKHLERKAKENGIELKAPTIKLLKGTSQKHHIEPIVKLGLTGKWDRSVVDKRTDRICDILWDRMNGWLS